MLNSWMRCTKSCLCSIRARVVVLALACTVLFALSAAAQTYTLAINTSGSGTVSASPSGPYAPGTLVTRRSDGALVLALWNYAEVGTTTPMRSVAVHLTHSAAHSANVQSIDAEHGNVRTAYERMGSPRYPTQRELAQLREAATLPAPVTHPLRAGELDLQIPSDGLVLVTVAAN